MKDFLNFTLGSLFSNNRILSGKDRKFYQSFIVVVLSLIFAILPIFTITMKSSGSEILTKTDNASLDVSLHLFSKYLYDEKANGVKFVTTPEGTFEATGFKDNIKEIYAGEKLLLTIRILKAEENPNDVADFYRQGINLEGKPSETPKSFILISDKKMNICIFAKNAKNTLTEEGTIKKVASYTSSYVGYPSNFKNQDFANLYDNSENGAEITYKNWKHALNKMYEPYKTTNVLYSVGLYTAINIAIILTMALITMILTRLKSAQCDKMNYRQALNCMNYAALCPALIGMLIGFLISSLASIGFVICIGVRSVFLGFKASQNKKY